jgi:hypothetical protein
MSENANTKMTPIRFTPEDRKLLAELQKRLGLSSNADVVRLGLRALRDNGLSWASSEARPTSPRSLLEERLRDEIARPVVPPGWAHARRVAYAGRLAVLVWEVFDLLDEATYGEALKRVGVAVDQLKKGARAKAVARFLATGESSSSAVVDEETGKRKE